MSHGEPDMRRNKLAWEIEREKKLEERRKRKERADAFIKVFKREFKKQMKWRRFYIRSKRKNIIIECSSSAIYRMFGFVGL